MKSMAACTLISEGLRFHTVQLKSLPYIEQFHLKEECFAPELCLIFEKDSLSGWLFGERNIVTSTKESTIIAVN